MTLIDPEGHLAFETFLTPTPREVACALIGKRRWPVNFSRLVKIERLLKMQSVTYTVKVVMSGKRRKTKTLLLQITNRK